MKIITTCLLMLILQNVSMVYGGITRKAIYDSDGNENYIFYKDRKEIAKQILDILGENVIKTVGKIPDGMVKEYYNTGGLSCEWRYVANKLEGISREYNKN